MDARPVFLELDRKGREAVLELRALHQPGRDASRSLGVIQLGELDAVLLELGFQALLQRLVPVGARPGADELPQLGRRRAPARATLDRLGHGVERVDHDLELEQVGALLEHTYVLVVVGHRGDVEGRHHVHHGAHRVAELAPLLPVAVGHAVPVAVGLLRVGEVLVYLVEVGEAVVVGVGLAANA
ncbi:MAG: hypothetical protein HOP15_07900 [Planctomycetes bacterium]|nr:hypothetical protein [Planctomycetota bacterium]